MILVIQKQVNSVAVNKQAVLRILISNFAIPSGINQNAFTQKGGVLVGTGAGTYVEQAPGTNNQILVYDDTEPAGVKAQSLYTQKGGLLSGNNVGSYEELAPGTNGQIIVYDSTQPGGMKVFKKPMDVEWISVKENGAIGDGVTDDTAAIQAVITGATAGDVVYFPPGSYLVDTLTLKPGVELKGAGPNATAMVARSNNTEIFKYVAASTQFHFSISGFYFALSTGVTNNCRGIHLEGTWDPILLEARRVVYVRIENCHFIGAFIYGIVLIYCANTYINNIFMALVSNGIAIISCADTDLVSCKVQNGTGMGFSVYGSAGAYDEGIRLIACSTNGQSRGLYVSDQDWGIATGCSFTTCATMPVAMINSDNWKFTGCEIAAAAAVNGMSVDANCQSIAIMACHFSLNVYGLLLSGTQCTVHGCTFEAGSNLDIYLSAAAKCSIAGNVCDSTGVIQSIYEAGAANYNAIVGNVTNGTVVIVGAQSIAANNVVY